MSACAEYYLSCLLNAVLGIRGLCVSGHHFLHAISTILEFSATLTGTASSCRSARFCQLEIAAMTREYTSTYHLNRQYILMLSIWILDGVRLPVVLQLTR